MKSKKTLIIVLIVVIALAAIYVFTRDDSVKNESVFYSFGELTRDQFEIMQNSEISKDNIAVLAKDFVIGFDYLENLTA